MSKKKELQLPYGDLIAEHGERLQKEAYRLVTGVKTLRSKVDGVHPCWVIVKYSISAPEMNTPESRKWSNDSYAIDAVATQVKVYYPDFDQSVFLSENIMKLFRFELEI